MKKTKRKLLILISIVLVLTSCAITKKKKAIITFVFDKENILTDVQTKQFDALFREHEKRTGNEIVLVTTPDYGADSTMLAYAVNFANKNGIGKKDKNNGVLILFSKPKRETRIATGYGTEKVLTDDTAKKIIDDVMIPQFKQGNTFEGLWQGSKAVVDFLDEHPLGY